MTTRTPAAQHARVLALLQKHPGLTAAELERTQLACPPPLKLTSITRGLSGLLRANLVRRRAGQRVCRVTGKMAYDWQPATIGAAT